MKKKRKNNRVSKKNLLASLKNTEKVIILDAGHYTHTSIYAWRNNKNLPVSYTYLNMITGDLKKVGVNKNDTIILALDKGKSWRKLIDSEYKSTRKKKRDAFKDIPWDKFFKEINKTNELLDLYTPIHVIGDYGWEADDIMAVGARTYNDKKVIIISADSDLEQLFAYKNVMIFSPKSKKFKEMKISPEKLLFKKIKKETADDLISPIKTEEDYRKRLMIVSLLELPEGIEKTIKEKISILPPKSLEAKYIPFNKIRNKFIEIFN